MSTNIICFHNPDEPNGWLSNWHLSEFEVGGVKYTSLEQYMMHCKALMFGDTATASKIMATADVAAIKKLGRSVSPFDAVSWSTLGLLYVTDGLYAKYSQNPQLLRCLLGTGEALLVECAVRDHIWACGRSMNDPRRFNPTEWDGKNQLGYATMYVRAKLRAAGYSLP